MIDSWDFYRLIKDRVYGIIDDDKEFKRKLDEMQIPEDIRTWLVHHICRN